MTERPRPATRLEVRRHYEAKGYTVRVHFSGAVFFRRDSDAVRGDPSAGWQDGGTVADYRVVGGKVRQK